MIHWCPEGHRWQPGLNLHLSRRHLKIGWLNVNLGSFISTAYRFRFRWWIKGFKLSPKLYISVDSYNLIESWAFDNDIVLLTHELYEDLRDLHIAQGHEPLPKWSYYRQTLYPKLNWKIKTKDNTL